MKIYLIPIRETDDELFVKPADANKNPTGKEYGISWDEWESLTKRRLSKNFWEIKFDEAKYQEQAERVKWLMQPNRLYVILRTNGKPLSPSEALQLGGISQDYQGKFRLSIIDFVNDCRLVTQISKNLLEAQ